MRKHSHCCTGFRCWGFLSGIVVVSWLDCWGIIMVFSYGWWWKRRPFTPVLWERVWYVLKPESGMWLVTSAGNNDPCCWNRLCLFFISMGCALLSCPGLHEIRKSCAGDNIGEYCNTCLFSSFLFLTCASLSTLGKVWCEHLLTVHLTKYCLMWNSTSYSQYKVNIFTLRG